jgi:hypothetical protein
MFIGVYILLAMIAFLSNLFLRMRGGANQFNNGRSRQWFGNYAILSLIMVTIGLVSFIALSVWTGILSIGVSTSYSIPQDTIKLGFTGWITLLIGMAGILSPFLAGFIADKILISKT